MPSPAPIAELARVIVEILLAYSYTILTIILVKDIIKEIKRK